MSASEVHQRTVLSRAFRIIEADCGSDSFSVDELARRSGVSRRVLERLFRRKLGNSPLQVINERRVIKARRLMAEAQSPISDIAVTVGFADAKSLRHHFRRSVGMTPGQWRNLRKPQTSLSSVGPSPST